MGIYKIPDKSFEIASAKTSNSIQGLPEKRLDLY